MKVLSFPFLTAILIVSSVANCAAQAGEWTWMGGSDTLNSFGNFQVEGIPTLQNMPPGIYACGYWTDTTGNFWIYGGTASSIQGNIISSTLWQFNPSTGAWAWYGGNNVQSQPESIKDAKGVYYSGNSPGSLGSGMFTWVTPDNHLWLFGGANGNNSPNNDLWQYNPSINQWAWMGTFGPVNYGTQGMGTSTTRPGGRYQGNSSWTDSVGNLWLFGGMDSLFRAYDDLWQYNVATGVWTWMSGSKNLGDMGNYGTKGIPSINHYPPARATNMFWKDKDGNFWLGGGSQVTQYEPELSGTPTGALMFQDVWKFNPGTLQWTWESGLQGGDTLISGNNCDPEEGNLSGPRFENTADWQVCNNEVVTYGGFKSWLNKAALSDMWAYNFGSNEWTKVNLWPGGGHYGTLGSPGVSNAPSARIGGAAFKDKNNNLWMFGGGIFTYPGGYLNDLWRYTLPGCIQTQLTGINTQLPANTICRGDSALLTLSGLTAVGISPVTGTSFKDALHIYLFPDSTTQYTITGRSACRTSDTTALTVYVTAPGKFTYSLSDTSVCRGNSVTLNLLGADSATIQPASSVVWANARQAALTPDSTTTFTVISHSLLCGGAKPDSVSARVTVTQPAPFNISIYDSVICGDRYDTIYISGLTQVTINPNNNINWYLLNKPIFYADGSYTYTVSGITSCLSNFSKVVTAHVLGPTNPYQLSKAGICPGDTSLLTIYGIYNFTLKPSSSITYIDSFHVLLHPDTTIYYALVGTYVCGFHDSVVIPLYVSRPGELNYELLSNTACVGYSDELYAYNVLNPQLTPSYNFYPIDSTDFGAGLPIKSAPVYYTLTGQLVCGGTDTVHFTVNGAPRAGDTLSSSSMCQGDSVLLKLTGLANARVSPSTGNRWIDSLNVMLHPDSTTVYTVTGTNCGGLQSIFYDTVHVVQPGKLSYFLSDPAPCYGYSSYLYFYGIKSLKINPGLNLNWTDSADAWGYIPSVNGTYTYNVTGQSLCGEMDTANITIRLSQLPPSYSGPALTICKGGSTVLSITSISNLSVTPPVAYSFIDSAHIRFYPDSSTKYIVSGLDCYNITYPYTFTITVMPSGSSFKDSLYEPSLCPASSSKIFVAGATNIQSNPALSFTYTDSSDAYTNVSPSGTTTYQISARSVCGAVDTMMLTVPVIPQATYTLTKGSLCRGDSTFLTINNLQNVNVAPVKFVTRVDSAHFYLHPDTTTSFIVSGTNCTGKSFSLNPVVKVFTTDTFSYTLSTNHVCPNAAVTLSLKGASVVSSSPAAAITWTDSTDPTLTFTADSTTAYRVNITDVCGGNDSAVIPVYVTPLPGYYLPDSVICLGDTVPLTVIGLSRTLVSDYYGGIITIDSAHYRLSPSYTTLISIQGYNCANSNTSYNPQVQVNTVSSYHYTLADTMICAGDSVLLQVYSIDSASINPYSPLSFYALGDKQTYLKPPVSTSYQLISNTICRRVDTASFHITVDTPAYYTLSDTSICRGDSVALRLYGFVNNSLTPYSWIGQNDGNFAYLVPDSTTTYSLSGRESCGDYFGGTFLIRVKGPLVSISVDSSTFCSATGVQICATSGISQYKWSSGQDSACIHTKVNGTYQVTVTDVNQCSAVSKQLTLNPQSLPAPTVTALPSRICIGDTSLICAAAGYATYHWNTGDSIACIREAQAEYYIVTVTNNGCTGISTPLRISIVIMPPPTLSAAKPGICQNDSTSICAPGGFSAYEWNGIISGTGSCIEAMDTGTYYAMITDSNGCKFQSDTLSIFMYPVPVNYISTGKPIFCFYDSTRICAPPGYPAYHWNQRPPGNTDCVEPKLAGTYYVTVTDRNGCTAESNHIVISIYPIPPVDSISTEKNVFCPDDSTRICSLNSFSSYQWNSGDNDTGPCVEAKKAGIYYLTVTDNNGCTVESNRISIAVYSTGTLPISIRGDTLSIGGVSFQWFRDNSPIGNTNDSVYIAAEPGSYSVEVTDTNGCTALSNVVDITGVNNLTEERISVYPNPSTGNWSVAVGNEFVGSQLQLFDEQGKLVGKYEIRSTKYEITASELPAGVYFLRISSSNASIVRKLVKL